MSDLKLFETAVPYVNAAVLTQPTSEPCDDCLGSGGWYRYEPGMDPAPGRLYLSCLHCRGTGHTAEAHA